MTLPDRIGLRNFMDKQGGQFSTPIRFFLWVSIIAYLAVLPHLIIVFKFILGLLPLAVIKALPGAFFLLSAVGYLGLCRLRGRGYGLTTFIIPSLMLIAGAFWLEPNPIKHTHIPLYAFLVGLIYCALRRHNNLFPIILASACYASMLGVLDEVHHGIHPERYFGWKDMVINSAGALIGAMLIGAIKNIKLQRPFNLKAMDKVFGVQLVILILNLFITAISVFYLFGVAKDGFNLAYPTALFVTNMIVIILCLAIVIFNLPKLKTSLEAELLLFFPSLILTSIQVLICFAYSNNIQFS